MALEDQFSFLADEEARLRALYALDILDTPEEESLDNLTRLATTALGVESAAICLVDRDRQWFKSRIGLPFRETARDISICTHAVTARKALVVPDASRDPRFRDSPLVKKDGGIRFYAGIPLFVETGHCVGTLCTIDSQPRARLTGNERALLEQLATLATELIETRSQRHMGDIAAKAVQTTSDAVVAFDRDGTLFFMNPAAVRMFGYSRKQALGQNVLLCFPERHRDRHAQWLRDVAEGNVPTPAVRSVELRALHPRSGEFPIELSLAPWGDREGRTGFAAVIRDISDRKQLEQEKHQARQFLDTIVSNLPAMLFVKDAQTREYILVNKKTADVVGRTPESMIGYSDHQLFAERGIPYENRDREAVRLGKPFVYESSFLRDDGSPVDIRTTRLLVDGPDRPGQYLLGLGEDLTAFRRAEAENYRLARYDTLTGLLNRASFTELLRTMVADRTEFAMLSVDLDRFKAVNDQFGHVTGDEVLRRIGDRLSKVVVDPDFVARIGGDEFVIILSGTDLRNRAQLCADRVIAELTRPVKARRITAHLGASVGIVLHPDDGTATESLRENVDLALYRAKRSGRGKSCFFDDEMDASLRDRNKLEGDLRAALETDQIYLRYQPVVCTATQRVTSAEALARWHHPERGPVAPGIFIAIAEECGLIDRLGKLTLRQACRDARDWPDNIAVAVNLSPLQFHSGELAATVAAVLEETGLPPRRLQLEVTERIVLHNTEACFAQLDELRALGIQILMDDFGVGHSSLSYFQHFRFDKVKIDKSFIDELANSKAARAIVRAVVGLGRQLSMGIVAEGVETREQRDMLTRLGCTHLQGYLFSEAIDSRTLIKFARRFAKGSLEKAA